MRPGGASPAGLLAPWKLHMILVCGGGVEHQPELIHHLDRLAVEEVDLDADNDACRWALFFSVMYSK